MRLPADRPAGELMAEFVRQHDGEKRQDFQRVPAVVGIGVQPAGKIEERKKPRPVEIDGDSGQTKQADGTFACGHQSAPLMSLSSSACDSTALNCGNSCFTFSGA